MSETRTLNVTNELVGMRVLMPKPFRELGKVSNTYKRLGEVTDAIVHPTEGRLLGLGVRTLEGNERVLLAVCPHEGDERVLNEHDFRIGAESVITIENALCDPKDLDTSLAGGAYACSELVGAKVVTDEGRLLGSVSEVHLLVQDRKVLYRVTESKWKRPFGGGFLMAGNAPRSYSRAGMRLIVPFDMEMTMTSGRPLRSVAPTN